MLALALMNPLERSRRPGACRVTGRATSGTTAAAGRGDHDQGGRRSSHATSTETDGGYAINLAPGPYTLSAELTGFSRVERAADRRRRRHACAQTVNLSLALAPRQPLPAAARAPQQPRRRPARRRTRRAAGGTRPRPGRFETVQVQPQADAGGAAGDDGRARGGRRGGDAAAAAARLLDRRARRRDRDHRQQRQHRSRHDERSLRRDRPRRVRSGDRRLRRGVRRSGRTRRTRRARRIRRSRRLRRTRR